MQRLLDFYYAAVVKPNKSESQVLAKLEAVDNAKVQQNIDRKIQQALNWQRQGRER